MRRVNWEKYENLEKLNGQEDAVNKKVKEKD